MPIPRTRTAASASKAPPRRRSFTRRIVCNGPMVRTRPKGDPNPGWVRITWDQALNLIALRLTDIKDNYGPEAVVFSRATTAGSAAIDFDGWLQRLGQRLRQPESSDVEPHLHLEPPHRLQIHLRQRHAAARLRQYTMHAALGHQSNGHLACAGGANQSSRNRGAKLIVIDPRKTTFAAKADCWLRMSPAQTASWRWR